MQKVIRELPEGYFEVACVRSAEMPGGFREDLKAVWPGLAVTAAELLWVRMSPEQAALAVLVFVLGIYPYFALHELVHGAVYLAAGQRAKIRFTKYGANCSLPELYVCWEIAVVCTAAPLVVFCALFGAWAVAGIALGHWSGLTAGALLTFHLLGCRSDVHLLKKLSSYRGAAAFVRDAGGEQRIFVGDKTLRCNRK